jgi:hypothetical protein
MQKVMLSKKKMGKKKEDIKFQRTEETETTRSTTSSGEKDENEDQ